MHEEILIIDFGSQYTQLIARKIRETNVFCEIYTYNHFPEINKNVKGVILSGSPFSVKDSKAPKIDLDAILDKVPVLGICYGAQYIADYFGGTVEPSKIREYGQAHLNRIDSNKKLFTGIKTNTCVWMSHGDTILKVPDNFNITASTNDVKVAAYQVDDKNIYGIQFHPEVYHTEQGKDIIKNFVISICDCNAGWTPASFIDTSINELKITLQNDKVVLGLSGGVDSTVAAMLLHKAIGKNLFCIFVDNGLLRKNEYNDVLEAYKDMGLQVKGVDAKAYFIKKLTGVCDPEKKRKIIGNAFIDIFEQEANALKDVKWLAQGTIYPDVIESISVKGPSATIKSHHNVGGLPERMNLKVVEPLRMLFKDEVRKVGHKMHIKPIIVNRHPFPGPGLAIRILGDITQEKIDILQEVDAIFINCLHEHGYYNKVWQAAAILLPIQSVGVMGDERTYEKVVALRAVSSTDGMTAQWVDLPYSLLTDASNKIINKVKGVNRVVYDISSKPPATIEWE